MKMKSMVRTVLAMGVASAVSAGAARAADEAAEPVSASVSVPILSSYVWRGQVLNDKPVIQPSMSIGKYGFALSAWANYNLTDRVTGKSQQFSEVDLDANYTYNVGPVALKGGIVEYLFPNQQMIMPVNETLVVSTMPSSREVYGSVGMTDYSVGCKAFSISPLLGVNYDFEQVHGVYGNAGLSAKHELCDQMTAGANASLGMASSSYNDYYFGVDKARLNDGNLGISATYSPVKSLSLTPAIQYTRLLDGDIRESADMIYWKQDRVVGSLTMGYQF